MRFGEGGDRGSDATQLAVRMGTGHTSRRVPGCVGRVVGIQQKEFLLPLSYVAFLCGFLLLATTTDKSLTKMPIEYYLGVGTPFLALLIGFGASAFPRTIPLLAALLLAGAFTATPITHTTDYRKMPAEMRSKCNDCPMVIGVGYLGRFPACVLYEAKACGSCYSVRTTPWAKWFGVSAISRTFL